MRLRITDKNMFPQFSLYEEYEKLEAIFSSWITIGTYTSWGETMAPKYTFEVYMRDVQFNSWNLRGTFINLMEMRHKLNIAAEDFSKKGITEGQLLDFIQFLLNCWLRISVTIEQCKSAYLADENALKMLLQNCDYLLDKLHCDRKFDEVNDEVYIVYNDEISSIVSENNPDVEISFLEYRRIDNRGDLQRKGEILCTLSKKIESAEGKIKGTEYQALLNDTTFLLNKTGARHWVEKDKLASATFLKMQPEELEKWYDTTFDLIVSCLAVLPYLNIKDQIKAIRQTEVTTNETSI